MKVLIGPLEAYERERLLAHRIGGHELSIFGPDGPLHYQPGERWGELLDRLPRGWQPDVVVWWSPEYRPWSVLDECPLPLVASVGDWNLNFTGLREILGRCDYIVTDRAGVERMRALGYQNVTYWPNFGFDPQAHRPCPGQAPEFDVLFIGNLNHTVQRQRARLLARLAQLTDRYRVAILGGIYGEEYARALARSRIVVNRSIRGEMNMRAYEAPACGALLLMERENLEVGEYFRDGVQCVLYGDDDFEELLERYLADEPTRARVAAAGHERVQTETYPAHMQTLLDRLSELDWSDLRRQGRRWEGLSAAERHYQSGRYLLQTGQAVHLARRELAAAVALGSHEPEYLNAAAVADSVIAVALQRVGQGAEAERYAVAARRGWSDLVARWPESALGWANAGLAELALGKPEAGDGALSEALGLLRAVPKCALSREGCYFTSGYNTFRVEWERVAADHAGEVAGAMVALGALLRWECARRLGELALERGLAQRAREMFHLAVDARPDLETGYAGRGTACERLGDPMAAIADYAPALERQPWDFTVRHRLAVLLYLAGDEARCAALCREGLALAQACPHYSDEARPLQGLLAQVAAGATCGGRA